MKKNRKTSLRIITACTTVIISSFFMIFPKIISIFAEQKISDVD